MARKYSSIGNAIMGTDVTAINIKGSATHIFYLFDITLGCATTPADAALKWEVGHTTADGTAGSSPTPTPLMGGMIAAIAIAGISYASASEPTYGGILLTIGLHQRSTYRWVARPGSEFVSNPAAGDGIAAKAATSTGTPTLDATFLFDE